MNTFFHCSPSSPFVKTYTLSIDSSITKKCRFATKFKKYIKKCCNYATLCYNDIVLRRSNIEKTKGDKSFMYFDNRKLLAQMVLRNVKTEDVAKELGINPATFYRKLNKDGEFTRSEIQKLIEFLNIEKPMDIFFATGDA
jgi:hypothetical protein